jgi:hypothetical protein
MKGLAAIKSFIPSKELKIGVLRPPLTILLTLEKHFGFLSGC